MISKDIIRIIIMGGDISGPMTAAMLARYLPKSRYELIFIKPLTLEKSEFFAHMPPELKALNRDLKIKELDFIKTTKASFSLGASIKSDKDFFIPFGALGPILRDTAFRHVLQRVKPVDLQDLNLSARLAVEHKFLLPQSSGPILLSGYDYGYHIDIPAFAELLTMKAQDLGGRVIEANLSSIDKSDGEIKSLQLDDGNEISGDFFIDCSGTQRCLSLSQDNQSWKFIATLPTHFKIETEQPNSRSLPSSSQTTFKTDGWSLDYQTQTQKTRLSFSNGDKNFSPGWVSKPWKKNMVSMGLSSFLLPPTEGWNLRLIYDQIRRLIEFMPTKPSMHILQKEYNRLSDERIRRVVDYAILRHLLPHTDIKEISEHRPDAYYKYTYYMSRGGLAVMDQDEDWKHQWTALLNGRFGWPERENIMAQEIDISDVTGDINDVREAINKIVSS